MGGRRRAMAGLMIFVTLVASTACASDDPTTGGIEGTWRMVEVNGAPVEVGVNTETVPEFTVFAGELVGNFGCNRGGGEFVYADMTIRIPTMTSQAALCSIPDGAEEMVETERTLKALLAGASVERSGGRMTWSGPPGSVVLELVER